MNANELADKLSDKTIRDYHLYEYLPEIVAMLRQLQAENEAVKRDNINYMNDLGKAMDEIETLKAGMEKLKDAYCERDNTVRQQQEQIEVMISILEQEGIGVGRDLLNGGIALFRKAQEK